MQLQAAEKSNEEVLREAEEGQAIMKLRKRQSKFMGHIMRVGGLGYLITTGLTEGKRDRGTERSDRWTGEVAWRNS